MISGFFFIELDRLRLPARTTTAQLLLLPVHQLPPAGFVLPNLSRDESEH